MASSVHVCRLIAHEFKDYLHTFRSGGALAVCRIVHCARQSEVLCAPRAGPRDLFTPTILECSGVHVLRVPVHVRKAV